MHSLTTQYNSSIPALYVKSASQTYHIRQIFIKARSLAPCMLIFEDIDTIVNHNTRSYFFNEVDGLENNDGIFMVATTNHLDQLDPGLSSRPSRFDRKYLFPLPSEEERTLYCEYWRGKLKNKPRIQFPQKLSPAIAGITQNFSFAYLKEAFVATLLVIAGHRSEEPFAVDEDLDDYELWREMKKQVQLLRKDMASQSVLDLSNTPSPPQPTPDPNPTSSNPTSENTPPPPVRTFTLPMHRPSTSESSMQDPASIGALFLDSGAVVHA